MLAAFSPAGPLTLSADQWGWLAIIGLVHTGGVYVVLYKALPKLTTPVIAVLLFLYPASAVLVDALAYGHLISALQLAGLGLIILSSLAVTLRWGVRRLTTRRRCTACAAHHPLALAHLSRHGSYFT